MSKREAIASCMVVFMLFFPSCKTVQVVEKVVEKTEYKDRLFKDSIFIHDSICVYQKGDTVFRNKIKYVYKDKLIRDTVRETVIDSIPYPVEVEKKLNKWNQLKVDVGGYLIGLILLLIAIIVGYCVKKK